MAQNPMIIVQDGMRYLFTPGRNGQMIAVPLNPMTPQNLVYQGPHIAKTIPPLSANPQPQYPQQRPKSTDLMKILLAENPQRRLP